MAEQVELRIDRGSTFRQTFIYKQANGTAVNLTGWSARMQIRKNATDSTAVADMSTENGRVTITPAEGKIDIVLPASDSRVLPIGMHVYDVIIYAGADVERIVEGPINISADVTRL